MDEFVKAIHDFQVEIDTIDIENLFKTIDLDQSGTIDFNEFIRVIVGEMNQARQNLVVKAFATLDINNDGEITLDEFQNKYDRRQRKIGSSFPQMWFKKPYCEQHRQSHDFNIIKRGHTNQP